MLQRFDHKYILLRTTFIGSEPRLYHTNGLWLFFACLVWCTRATPNKQADNARVMCSDVTPADLLTIISNEKISIFLYWLGTGLPSPSLYSLRIRGKLCLRGPFTPTLSETTLQNPE